MNLQDNFGGAPLHYAFRTSSDVNGWERIWSGLDKLDSAIYWICESKARYLVSTTIWV